MVILTSVFESNTLINMRRKKEYLQTVRLTKEEKKRTDQFLKLNPIFESFSSLARAAIIDFVGEAKTLALKPTSSFSQKKPYFLWDYNLTEGMVKEILSLPSLDKKKWLIARILVHCRFQDVWKYLSISEIKEAIPFLRMSQRKKEHWQYAIDLWTKQ